MKFSNLFILVIVVLIVFFSRCANNEQESKIPDSIENASGEQLSKIYCSSCHLFPSPELLNTATWKNSVLPNMGWRLGIHENANDPYKDLDKDEVTLIKATSAYPDEPIINKEQWGKIVQYYLTNAPEKYQTRNEFDSISPLTGFTPKAIQIGNTKAPKTTVIKFDPLTALLFIGDAGKGLYALNRNLKMVANWQTESPAVDIDFFKPGSTSVLCIGSMAPTEKKSGSYYPIELPTERDKPVSYASLGRPVYCEHADINNDGVADLIVSEFGNYTGQLSWFDGITQKKNLIKAQAGARKTVITDVNNDGLPDIIAMFAQAKEEVILFINKGDNTFKEKVLVQFPPVYGSSYFEMADFNKDGFPDLMITAGDNWDLSPIRKNYHGIRIFENDGKYNFTEKKFIPLFGTSKAMAYDFDKDGDLDIAAISFYDDPEKTGQSFLYLENKGSMHFVKHISQNPLNGKWLTMDLADIDLDGDMDIILGSYFHTFGEFSKLLLKEGAESFPQAIILYNNIK